MLIYIMYLTLLCTYNHNPRNAVLAVYFCLSWPLVFPALSHSYLGTCSRPVLVDPKCEHVGGKEPTASFLVPMDSIMCNKDILSNQMFQLAQVVLMGPIFCLALGSLLLNSLLQHTSSLPTKSIPVRRVSWTMV